MGFSSSQKNKISESLKFGFTGLAISVLIALIIGQTTILIEAGLLGFTIGFMVGLFENFVSHPKFRRLRFIYVVLIRTTVYGGIIIASVLLVALLKLSIVHQCTLFEAMEVKGIFNYIIESNLHFALLFLITLSFFINFIWQINLLLGPGVLFKYIAGKYHKPKPEQRIFLFLDLNSSTSIAEKLGTEKYSSFLKDFFSDLTEAILQTKGEIYQYCGDEVVVVWNLKNGIKDNNVLKFFFLVEKSLQKKKEKYLEKYSRVPEFKAGIHYGETLITEVGDLKKEIVYHGDLVNTTSRIKSVCNKLDQKILISKDLLDLLDLSDEYHATDLGNVPLRGKKINVNLFGIKINNYAPEIVLPPE